MAATQDVHASVSKRPIALHGDDLPTVCVLCSHNCGIRVDVADGRIAAIRPDEANPITHGYICNKAVTCDSYAHHDQRVTHPLRRRPDGSFEQIGWEDAIAEIAAKLGAIRDRHGARAIGLIGIGGQANHMDAPYATSFLRAIGSRRWFNAFAQEKTQHCLVDHWMFDAPPVSFFHPDLEHARYLLVMGTNPRISNRGHNATETFKAIGKNPDVTLVVADPRETETTRGADRHLKVRPGTDAYLLLGMAAAIVQNELYNAEFLATKTTGFNELRDVLARVDVGEMAARCGLDREVLMDVATGFAKAPSAAIMFDLGVEQIPFSTLVSYLIRLNCTLTGNLGVGGNLFVEGFLPPTLSGGRFEEPERALASGIAAIRALGNFGMFSPTLVPEEIQIDHPERLRALVVEGSNPFLSYSDSNRWHEARKSLDLLVVIEPAMTETARQADYVLPTPVGYEKWEIAMFPKGYPEIMVQLRPPVIPGPPEALPEAEIYARLCEALGVIDPLPEDLAALGQPESAEARGAFLLTAFAKAAEATERGINAESQVLFWAYRGIGHHFEAPSLVSIYALCQNNAQDRKADVLRTLGPQWSGKHPFEIGEALFDRVMEHPSGVEIARADLAANLDAHVGFEDKRVRIAPEPMLPELERAIATAIADDGDYPFTLAAGVRTRWNANTIQRDPAWRKGNGPHCELYMSPGDASRMGLGKGARVRVETPRGAVELPVAVDKKQPDGYVAIPNGFGMAYPDADGNLVVQGVNVNELTDAADRDPFTGCPHHKTVRVRITTVDAAA